MFQTESRKQNTYRSNSENFVFIPKIVVLKHMKLVFLQNRTTCTAASATLSSDLPSISNTNERDLEPTFLEEPNPWFTVFNTDWPTFRTTV